jgi:hypothetical protein
MSQPVNNASGLRRKRWPFSVRGMLLFAVSIAIGAAVAFPDLRDWLATALFLSFLKKVHIVQTMDWTWGLIAVLVFWMVLGIINQARDLRISLAEHPDLPRELKFGGQFEIFWRLSVAILLVIYLLIRLVVQFDIVDLPEREFDPLTTGFVIREGVFALLLLIIVGSIPYVRREQQSSTLHRGLTLVAYILAAAICLEQWADKTIIYHLVHIAILGIDWSQPLKFSAVNPHDYSLYTKLFFWLSLLAGIIVVANWAILGRLARQWSMGIWRRLLWIGLLVIGVVAASAYVIWVYTRALWQISPIFAATGSQAPWHCWIAATLLAIILVTLVTYRMTTNRDPIAESSQVNWRRNPKKYYHEWRTVLTLLAIILIWLQVVIFISFLQIWWNNRFTYQSPWIEAVRSILSWPVNLLWLSLILLAVHRAFVRRADPKRPQAQLPRISPARFATVWLGALAVTISSILVLVWMSFAFWFNPWWSAQWP